MQNLRLVSAVIGSPVAPTMTAREAVIGQADPCEKKTGGSMVVGAIIGGMAGLAAGVVGMIALGAAAAHEEDEEYGRRSEEYARQRARGNPTPQDESDAIVHKAARDRFPKGMKLFVTSQNQWTAIAAAVNQGIDAHLEAFTRSSFDPSSGQCEIHPDEVHILVRRLDRDRRSVGGMIRNRILINLGLPWEQFA